MGFLRLLSVSMQRLSDLLRFRRTRTSCAMVAAMGFACVLPGSVCYGQSDAGGSTRNQWRLPDDRPQLDRSRVTAAGLHVLESQRLRLVTDLPPDSVRELPSLADALFDELERSCGKLAANVAGTEFQVTGYLMAAPERFADAGLSPPEGFAIRHGRHLGYQFWMNNQTADYYRRHLLLHEFIHCFMMCEHGMRDIPPLWYTEGIAEYFATHALAEDVSRSRFGAMPTSLNGFEGWGRISELHVSPANNSESAISSDVRRIPLELIRHPLNNSFVEDLQYAQAWALYWLLKHHPELRNSVAAFSSVRTRQQFLDAETSVPAETWQRLAVIWPLFRDSVIEGFDEQRSFPLLGDAPRPLASDGQAIITVDAARGWQSTGILFSEGAVVSLECSGRYTMHNVPRAWISEPQGITIDYWNGRPLGEVIAMYVAPDGQIWSDRQPIGRQASIRFPFAAELWLQINDSAAQRDGNSGTVEVRIAQQ